MAVDKCLFINQINDRRKGMYVVRAGNMIIEKKIYTSSATIYLHLDSTTSSPFFHSTVS